ncbi:adhesion G protein-coupled receptor L1-like [Pecten maximus]|uniref:adhesion G protein-coupled receptor L1-like n=1 Tax=Pecten maximus TaxID=6579 RepID=UPI00145802B8|nr:adhesion G protein-coupled receptor L1-like [Pecten maximus]
MDKSGFGTIGLKFWIVLNVCLLVNGQQSNDECGLNQTSLHKTGWSGMVRSQNGTKYCVWKIQVPAGNLVKINFTLLLIDGFIPSSDCTRHGVKVTGGNVSRLFCLTSTTTDWIVPSNEVEISIVSTDKLHRSNIFALIYEAICGGMQDLETLFAPELPPGTEDCTWTIRHNRAGRKTAFHTGNTEDWTYDIETLNGTITADVTNPWIYLDSNTINITVHRRKESDYNNHSSTSNNTQPLGLTVQSLGADNPCPEVCGKYGYCEPKNISSEYYCHCMKGYKGQNCTEIAYDGPYCDESVDDVLGDNILVHWTITEANHTDTKPCPQGRIGVVSRPCIPDGQGGAMWGRPDLTGCVSQHIKDIENMANQLKQNNAVDKTAIINITASIVNATSSQGDGPAAALYPGDLVVSTDVFRTIADVSKQSRDNHNDLDEIAQGYGEAVSGLVDDKIAHVWKLIDLDFVEERMASILTSMATLAGNIANVRVSSEHKRNKREMSNQSQSLSINSSTDNIDFSITFHEKIAMCDTLSSFTMGGNSDSSITIPSTVFRNAVKASQDRYIQVYAARFSSITDILTSSQQEQEKQTRQESKNFQGKFINSDIVSGSVLNIPEDVFDNLDEPIRLVIEIKNITLLASYKEKCVFMNLTEDSHEMRWSSKGCREDVTSSNNTHIVCLCNHFTNFAVLMDVFGVAEKIDDDDNAVLTYISYGGGGLSVLCCIISVIVFEYYRIRNERIRTHEQLAITFIFVQVLFIGGIDRTENQYVCMSIAIALHYFLTAMFCWMLLEGFHLYVLLVKVFKRGRNFGKYLLVGWGVPLVVVGITAGIFHDKYGNDKVCWLSHDMLLVVFLPAVGLVIVINTVVLLMVLRIMMRTMPTRANSEDRSAIRAGLKAAVVLLPLLGLTWTIGFLSVENKEALVFTYLFTLFNSLQGVFFFIFHCLLSVDVQKAYKRQSRKKNSISWTNFTGKTRKSSDQDTFYSNSKESVNTLVTDASSLDRRTRTLANGVDRIYRDARQSDSHNYSSNILYHDQLYRSKSDETAKTTSFRHQHESISFDDQTGLRFYRGQYSLKTPPRRSSVRYQDEGEHTPNGRQLEDSTPSNIEPTYSKPFKRVEHQQPLNSEIKPQDNHVINHVKFQGSEITEEDEVFKRDPIRTTPKRKGPIVNTVSSEDFLKELKQRTASFRDN